MGIGAQPIRRSNFRLDPEMVLRIPYYSTCCAEKVNLGGPDSSPRIDGGSNLSSDPPPLPVITIYAGIADNCRAHSLSQGSR